MLGPADAVDRVDTVEPARAVGPARAVDAAAADGPRRPWRLAGYGEASYWQYLDDAAAEQAKYDARHGIETDAWTRSLSQALMGNDGV